MPLTHQQNNSMNKSWHLAFGAFFALTSVILGAFGAHALKDILTQAQLVSFETGVRYQMFHAFAILLIAFKGHHFHLRFEKWIVTLFGVGIILFSFSIYALSLRQLIDFEAVWLGPITPIGGSLLTFAWLMLLADAVLLLKNKNR